MAHSHSLAVHSLLVCFRPHRGSSRGAHVIRLLPVVYQLNCVLSPHCSSPPLQQIRTQGNTDTFRVSHFLCFFAQILLILGSQNSPHLNTPPIRDKGEKPKISLWRRLRPHGPYCIEQQAVRVYGYEIMTGLATTCRTGAFSPLLSQRGE